MNPEVLPLASQGHPSGPSWRHLATLLLLLVTVPVFLFSAVLTLPVVLVVGAAEGLRKALQPQTRSRSTPPY